MNGFQILLGLLACVLLTSAFEADVEGDNYIVGGRNAAKGQFPWLVSFRTVKNQHFCGGFVLSKRWVGTAAHCTKREKSIPRNIIVVTGALTPTDGTRRRVIRIVIHPRYEPRYFRFDIAVVQTAYNIEFNALVQPVSFPKSPIIRGGTPAVLAGWGSTTVRKRRGTGLSPVLQWIPTRVISNNECAARFRPVGGSRWVNPTNICTLKARGVGACTSDGGGPVIVPVPRRPKEGVIVGFITWAARACASGLPDGHERFWTAIPFIRAATENSIPNLPRGPQ